MKLTMVARGFTLPELLVAVALLAIVSVMSYRGLDGLLRNVSATETESAYWRRLARGSDRVIDELRLILPNPRALQTVQTLQGELSRVNFLRRPRVEGEPAQRLELRMTNERLELLHWPDMAGKQAPQIDVLLEDITGFELRYLDIDKQWRDSWPSVTRAPLPLAVRLRLTLRDGGSIERVVALT